MNQEQFYYELEKELVRTPLNDVEAFLDCARYNDDGDAALLREYLEQHPTDIDARDSQGRTAVHMAAANGHMPILEMLFEFRPQKDMPNYEGNTALHHAALNNRVAAARRLLRKGWKPSAVNNSGRTPLQLIQGKNFEDMETALMEHDDTLDTYVPPAGSGVITSEGADAVDVDEPEAEEKEVKEEGGQKVRGAAAVAPCKEPPTTKEGMLGSADVDGVE